MNAPIRTATVLHDIKSAVTALSAHGEHEVANKLLAAYEGVEHLIAAASAMHGKKTSEGVLLTFECVADLAIALAEVGGAP